jgi:Zn-dependent protease with chaperone function
MLALARLVGRVFWYTGLLLLMLAVFAYNAAVITIIVLGIHPHHPGFGVLWGFGAELGLVIVGLSPPGQAVAAFLAGFRRPTDWERDELERTLGRVRRATGYRRRVVLHVLPLPVVNGFALGTRHLAVTRGAFNLPADELEAVVAHEVGHLAARHNLVTGALSLMSIVGSVVQWLAFWMGIGMLAGSLAQRRSRRRDADNSGMAGAVILLAFVVVSWVLHPHPVGALGRLLPAVRV